MRKETKRYNLLDELAKCSGYDIALMTTFNFEIGFFERAVLNRLYAKNVKKISLFIDSEEFTKSLHNLDIESEGSYIGRKYMVNPIQIKGSFHPKLVLLLGKKKARLFIGSANIKTSGYSTNNEIFNFIDFNENSPENLDIIVSAMQFFIEINRISFQLDNAILDEVRHLSYYRKALPNENIRFISNINDSILNQTSDFIKEGVTEIKVAVPYYDNELAALRSIKECFPKAKVRLYIQNKYSSFPIALNNSEKIVQNINAYTSFKDCSKNCSGNFYHGKVFLFKSTKTSYVLYGSANCTQAALIKTHTNGGNVECDLLEKGLPGEFDYFFENIEVEKNLSLESQTIKYESVNSGNFIYKYGEAAGGLTLHISFSKAFKDLEIKHNSNVLPYEVTGKEIIVSVPEDYRESLTDIFDITLEYDGKSETLRCWTFSSTILTNNREKQRQLIGLEDFDINASGDKYIEDQIKLIKAQAVCLPELIEYKKNQQYALQIKQEQEGDDGEVEDWMIDFEIPETYRDFSKQNRMLLHIRDSYITRFLSGSLFGDVENGSPISKKHFDTTESQSSGTSKRRATTAEKRYERFVKSTVRSISNNTFVTAADTEHYLWLVLEIFAIFNKYNNVEKVEDIFTDDFVAKEKISLLTHLISKDLSEITEYDNNNLRKRIIQESFRAIFDIYYYYKSISDSDERYKFESMNRSFLLSLEKAYHIREDYIDILKEISSLANSHIADMGMEASQDYLEKLFGYKSIDMLYSFIRQYYEDATIEEENNSLYITAFSDHIQDHLRPQIPVLSEIRKYARNISKINYVYITINNAHSNLDGKNQTKTIKHTVNITYSQWSKSQIRQNGSSSDSKTQFLSF